jgi:DNA-binding NarL/FixJ family response regulator
VLERAGDLLASVQSPFFTGIIMSTIAQANFPKLDGSPSGSDHGEAKTGCLIEILIVDAHFLIRDALLSVLKELNNHMSLLEAVDGHQAMQLVSEHADIKLILLELNLPDQDGFSVLSELRERHSGTPVVVLSARQDRESVTRALDLGAAGFIPKSARREITLTALRLVLAGGTYIPPEILAPEGPSLPKLASAWQGHLDLTERQVKVLQLLMQGKSNRAICRALNLTEPTVKNHVTAILKTLKVTSRTEAVIAVRQLGWGSENR